MTDIYITPKWHEVKPDGYYVYLHRYASGPKQGEVFYVGKGKGLRAWDWSVRRKSTRWHRTAKKYGVIVDIVKENMHEVCSFSYEKTLIHIIGIDNLVNYTLGGEGHSGYSHTKETREKLSRIHKGIPKTKEHVEKVRAARKGWVPSDETRLRMSISHIGKTQSMETRNKRSSSLVGRVFSDIHIQRLKESQVKKYVSVETECGIVFESVTKAVEFLIDKGYEKASRSSIRRSAQSTYKTAYGYKWRYSNDS